MLSSIRKFSTSFMGKIVIALIAIAFIVGFGMSGSFSGKQNIVAQINDEKYCGVLINFSSLHG